MERTQLCIPALKCSLEGSPAAWERALFDAASRRAIALAEHALVVLVAYSDGRGKKTVSAHVSTSRDGAPIALVLGAHDLCDINNVQGESLRHLVLLVDPQERPGWLTAIDLSTETGMTVDGERGIRRVEALGSVRLEAGTADVLAVTLLPGEPVDAAALSPVAAPVMPPRGDVRLFSAAKNAPKERPQRPTPVQGNAAAYLTSRGQITAVSPLPSLEGILRFRPTDAELDAGILIGRYDRCSNKLDDGLVSRVHALILPRRNRDELIVIDTASTNGTEVHAAAARHPVALGILKRATVTSRRFRITLGSSMIDMA